MANQPKTPRRSIRVDDSTWAALQAVADNHALTVSEVVRLALTDFLKRSMG